VSVRDSGPGIAPEDQARLFEPFERGAHVAEEYIPGLGLGLAVVRDLAAAIAARIELASQPGVGSTFTVVLPIHQPGSTRGVLARARRAGGGQGGGPAPAPPT